MRTPAGRGPDERQAAHRASMWSEARIDSFVESIRRRARGNPVWSLHGYGPDGRFSFEPHDDRSVLDGLMGGRLPPDTVAVGVAFPGPTGGDEVHVVLADGRRRGAGTVAVAPVHGRVVDLILARLLQVTIDRPGDPREVSLTLVARSCLGAASDGTGLGSVVLSDPVALTASVLGHLGGVATGDVVDDLVLAGRMLHMAAGARRGRDWIDDSVFRYLDGDALRRSVAAIAQAMLDLDDAAAEWLGADVLVSLLDVLSGSVDELLSMAAAIDPGLAEGVGVVIADRRRRWGLDDDATPSTAEDIGR